MVINQSLLNQLTEQAKASPRLRMNYDLRNSEDDGSQRMLNAIEPGSVIFECKEGPYVPHEIEGVLTVNG
jgi:hypothetical protein